MKKHELAQSVVQTIFQRLFVIVLNFVLDNKEEIEKKTNSKRRIVALFK